jgi:hypothetical protein
MGIVKESDSLPPLVAGSREKHRIPGVLSGSKRHQIVGRRSEGEYKAHPDPPLGAGSSGGCRQFSPSRRSPPPAYAGAG